MVGTTDLPEGIVGAGTRIVKGSGVGGALAPSMQRKGRQLPSGGQSRSGGKSVGQCTAQQFATATFSTMQSQSPLHSWIAQNACSSSAHDAFGHFSVRSQESMESKQSEQYLPFVFAVPHFMAASSSLLHKASSTAVGALVGVPGVGAGAREGERGVEDSDGSLVLARAGAGAAVGRQRNVAQLRSATQSYWVSTLHGS
jgi:hypothetical protein